MNAANRNTGFLASARRDLELAQERRQLEKERFAWREEKAAWEKEKASLEATELKLKKALEQIERKNAALRMTQKFLLSVGKIHCTSII